MTSPNPVEKSFWDASYWEAVVNRDSRMNGVFYYAVLSTGVYCRPTCQARRPRRENVVFFEKREQAERAGFRACLRCRPQAIAGADPQAAMVEKVCRYLESHLEDNVTLGALARELRLSPFHVQRTFRELMGVTPRAYADACRLKRLKSGLRSADTVSAAQYEAGYAGSSRLYERSDGQLGMTPGAYRKGGRGMRIRYSVADTQLGRLLVGVTDRGICSIAFGDSDNSLVEELKREFSAAEIEAGAPHPGVADLIHHLEGHPLARSLPLDIRANAFERRVWEHLRSIPYGKTESYAQVAQALGRPRPERWRVLVRPTRQRSRSRAIV